MSLEVQLAMSAKQYPKLDGLNERSLRAIRRHQARPHSQDGSLMAYQDDFETLLQAPPTPPTLIVHTRDARWRVACSHREWGEEYCAKRVVEGTQG